MFEFDCLLVARNRVTVTLLAVGLAAILSINLEKLPLG
jgi:hypothetical protein